MTALTETRSGVGTKGEGRGVVGEGSSPEMVLGNRVLNKGPARSANMWFNRRDVFAFSGVEDRKREGLCPYSDRRRWIVNQVLAVDFRHGGEVRIVFAPSNEGSSAGFDLAEETRGRLGLSEVDGEAVEVEEGLLKGVDVVLVVNVRVQLSSPFQGGGGGPGRGKVD